MPAKKLQDDQCDIIEARLQAGESLRSIAKSYGVCYQTLQHRRERWGKPKLKPARVRGADHANWKGGVYIDFQGYKRVFYPEGGRALPYAYEHTVIIEKRIGRRIASNEVVHHIDGDKSNNADENLILATRSHHKTLHAQLEALAFELVREGKILFDGERYRWPD